MPGATPNTREELPTEPMSDSELRVLLARLGQEEFDASPQATVGAVVEATGADPVVIARLLGEIRQEAFEQRFAQTFGLHEQVLVEHAERLERLETTSPMSELVDDPFLAFDTSTMEFTRRGHVSQTQSVARVFFVLLAVALLAIVSFAIFIAVASAPRSSPAPSGWGRSGFTTTVPEPRPN